MVTFSGDKLLGGPQAGVVVGRTASVARMRRHPLMRALRPDKMCLAALEATLSLWRNDASRVPLARMLAETTTSLEARARDLLASLSGLPPVCACSVARTSARIGGGAAPLHEVESRGLRVAGIEAERLASSLRQGDPAVVARIEDGAVLVDLRTVPPEEDALLGLSLRRAIERTAGV